MTPCDSRPFRIPHDWFVRLALLVVAALCVVTSFITFRADQSLLPWGCDPFGYLYQAESVRTGKLLGDHTERPFLKPLVAELAHDYPDINNYAWTVAPHAYHYNPHAGRVVNQYPPGTAFVLAVFPKSVRALAYPAVTTASILLLLLIVWRNTGWKLAAGGMLVILAGAASLVLHPFAEQYRSVGSVAMTFALLVGAGWLVRARPMLALGLASASVLFRISNAWLLPLVAMPYVFGEWFRGEKPAGIRSLVIRALKAGCLMFFAGAAWILLYQWLLLGSPLRFTYSTIDQQMSNEMRMWVNARFYFNLFKPNWFAVHLSGLACAVLLFRKVKRRWFWWGLAICVWNYAFYITHQVTTLYYTYASALIVLGLCFSTIEDASRRVLRVATCVFTVATAVILASSLHHPKPLPAIGMEKQIAEYQRAFAGADVCWAEISSSTFEYALGKPGFRINWGSVPARETALRWLHDNGYTQAIMLDDHGTDTDMALRLVKETGLAAELRQDPYFHRILWIMPRR